MKSQGERTSPGHLQGDPELVTQLNNNIGSHPQPLPTLHPTPQQLFLYTFDLPALAHIYTNLTYVLSQSEFQVTFCFPGNCVVNISYVSLRLAVLTQLTITLLSTA